MQFHVYRILNLAKYTTKILKTQNVNTLHFGFYSIGVEKQPYKSNKFLVIFIIDT